MSSTTDANGMATGTRPGISAPWVVLVVAAAIGLAAALLAQRYLRTQVEEINARAQVETVPLVVASSALEKGAHLTSANVAVRPVPRAWAHSNAITPEQFERLDNAVLAFPARIGEPIVWLQLESDKAPTFSARLAPGRRAVTVPIDEVSSISGMVQPGDLIDLMLTIRRGARDLAFVLQQSVPVLATGTQVEQKRNGAPHLHHAHARYNARRCQARDRRPRGGQAHRAVACAGRPRARLRSAR